MENRIRILYFLFRILFFSSLYLSHPIHCYLLCNLWSCLSVLCTTGLFPLTAVTRTLRAAELQHRTHSRLRRLEALEQRDSASDPGAAPAATSEPSARRGRVAGAPVQPMGERGVYISANGRAGRVPAQPMGAPGVRRRRDGGGAVLAGRAARGEAEAVSDGAALGRGGTPGAASSPSPREPRLGSPRSPR